MSTTEVPRAVKLGDHGDPCAECGAPLAEDQRYCLRCGARRGGPRVPFPESRGEAAPPPSPPAEAAAGAAREWTPLTAIGLVAVIALVLVAGFALGNGTGGDGKPQVVSVAGGTGTASRAGGSVTKASSGTFTADWPSGKRGYTVELGAIDRAGAGAAQVAKAKTDAQGKGAARVGALDSDDYPSLPGGSYVVYSGVYGSKAAAAKALKGLKKAFPDARVVRVGPKGGGSSGGGDKTDTGSTVKRAQLKNLDKLSGDNYVKQSKKLPDTTQVGGTAPPKDKKAPGGGAPEVEIK